METVPPLPIAAQDGGEVSIIIRDAVTVQQILNGALRMVVKDAAGAYHDCLFAMTGGGIGVTYSNGATAVEVGVINAFDGEKKVLTMSLAQSRLTIEDVLLSSAMPDVIMYPEVLTDQTQYALLLFKDSIQEQALVDGALELVFENERNGEIYYYPEVYNREGDAHYLYIEDPQSTSHLFASQNFDGGRLTSLLLAKTSSWSDNTLKISKPQRLMWLEGFELSETFASHDGLLASQLFNADDEWRFYYLYQNEGCYIHQQSGGGQYILEFAGGLSLSTVFTSEEISGVQDSLKFVLRKDAVGKVCVIPLYAARLNQIIYSFNASISTSALRRLDLSFAKIGDSSPLCVMEV